MIVFEIQVKYVSFYVDENYKSDIIWEIECEDISLQYEV